MTVPAEFPEEELGSHAAAATVSDVATGSAGSLTGQAPAARVPDFFIIGHEKCGTTALYTMLRRHPQVFMPDVKEPRFFSPELWARVPERDDELRPETLEDYLALFAGAGAQQRVGEASPQYIRSPTAASQIAAARPDARIIAILREPVSFLHSYHLQCVQAGRESERDLRKALALEGTRRQGKHIPREFDSPAWLLYSTHVRYVEQLRRYHAEFPAEQVLVLIYDDYRQDNEATIRKVQRFLEVDDTVPIEPIRTRRTLSTVRFTHIHPLTRRLRLATHRPEAVGPIARTATSLAPKSLRVLWRRLVYTAPTPPDRELMLELRRRFKPEVEALSEYLGRDLVGMWGYDSV